jgi:hypothetical protein
VVADPQEVTTRDVREAATPKTEVVETTETVGHTLTKRDEAVVVVDTAVVAVVDTAAVATEVAAVTTTTAEAAAVAAATTTTAEAVGAAMTTTVVETTVGK